MRESNGEVTRNRKRIHLGDYAWGMDSDSRFYSPVISDAKVLSSGFLTTIICSKYATSGDLTIDKSVAGIYSNSRIYIKDTTYTDAITFKASLDGVYAEYELATPTTETSSPFADPMSLNGCTTEEYVDDRTIPVPVGHETQYMGQSEDVVEIPSGSLSDGKRKFVAETSGGKTQYYFEGEEEEDSEDISSVLHAYTGYTLSNVHAKKYGKVIEIAFTSTGSYEYLTGLYVAYLTAYKPPKELSFTVYNSVNIPVGGGWITTSGVIYIRSNVNATLTEIKINTMYII